MKITVEKSELLAAIKRVLPFVERKTTIPVLSNLLVKAEGDTVSVTATDLDNYITLRKSWAVKEAGSITIPARKLSDVITKLKTLDAASVTIEADESNWVKVSCGPLSVKLPGTKDTNFPTVPSIDKAGITLPAKTFAGLVQRTRYAIAEEESRYTLNGALFEVEPARVRMVATDGHRLAVAESTEFIGQFTETFKLLFTRSAIDNLNKLAGDGGDFHISKDDTYVCIRGAEWTMVSRILIGQFPNWQAVMPKQQKHFVTILGRDLKDSVSRIAAFADERSRCTRWELVPKKGIKLSASSTETGDASELVKVPYDGDALTFGLSAKYVEDMLSSLDKDQIVTLAVKDPQSSAMWTPIESTGFTTKSILMPMRL